MDYVLGRSLGKVDTCETGNLVIKAPNRKRSACEVEHEVLPPLSCAGADAKWHGHIRWEGQVNGHSRSLDVISVKTMAQN